MNSYPLLVCFPGGGGGNWLSNLIFRLEYNKITDLDKNYVNFHSTIKSRQVLIDHCSLQTVSEDRYIKKIIFAGFYSFNIYINSIYKNNDFEQIKNNTQKKFRLLVRDNFPFTEATQKILYLDNIIDLNFDLLFDNPEQFIKDLYTILDQTQISYIKNNDLVLQSIEQFKKSCIDPIKVFENYNDPIWLAWAMAVAFVLGLKNSSSTNDLIHLYPEWTIDLLKKELLPYKTTISEFTTKRMWTNFK